MEAWEVILREANSALDRENYVLALQLAERAVTETERVSGPEHLNTAMAKFSLASAHFRNNNHQQAESLAEEVLISFEKLLGPVDGQTADVLTLLQFIYASRKKYLKARSIAERLLGVTKVIWGEDHPLMATAIMNLAQIYYAEGRFPEAEPLINRAIAIWNKCGMMDNREMIPVFQNVADFFFRIGKTRESEKWEDHASDLLTKTPEGLKSLSFFSRKKTAITKKKSKRRRNRTKRRSLMERGFMPYLGSLRIRKPNKDIVLSDSIGIPRFAIFGDESTAPGIVVYALIVFSTEQAFTAQREFSKVIANAELPENTRLHAKEIFHGDTRKSTPWARLDKVSLFKVLKEVFNVLIRNQAIFSIGVVDQSTYPQKIGEGFEGEFTVTTSELIPLAFSAAASSLLVTSLGRQEVELRWYLDPQITKAHTWGMGRSQVQRMFTSVGGVELEPIGDPKPVLLDAADLFAYIAARAISPESGADTEVFREWYQLCDPLRSQMWWVPDRANLPSSMLREISDSTRIEL